MPAYSLPSTFYAEDWELLQSKGDLTKRQLARIEMLVEDIRTDETLTCAESSDLLALCIKRIEISLLYSRLHKRGLRVVK
jgi:hypothetical protein